MDMRHAHPLGPLEHNMQCCSIKDRIILYPYTGSPKTKRSPLVGSGIFYMDPGPSNQDHSLFGLLDFQLYHAEVDITFFFVSTLPIISTNPCWTVERSPKRVRFLHSKG